MFQDADAALYARMRWNARLAAAAAGAILPGARDEAARRYLDVQFIKADASAWRGTGDRVLCVGASHPFGGTAAALRALAGHVPAGGLVRCGLLAGCAFSFVRTSRGVCMHDHGTQQGDYLTMNISVTLVLGAVVIVLCKYAGMRMSHAAVCIIFGFYLASTSLHEPVPRGHATAARQLSRDR